jgi:hypothetical protein
VLLGDFNRRLDEEASQQVPAMQVRTDGTDPAGPHKPAPDGRVTSRYLWQEISDGKPSLVQVPLVSSATGCTGFVGLDHILITESLSAQQPSKPTSTKIPVFANAGQKIATSDHCPRVTRLSL